MDVEFNGIEMRLDELSERLAKLKALSEKSRVDFDRDGFLRDIVERNLEVAGQCCIDISHSISALEKALNPADCCEAISRMGELGILPVDLARRLAPVVNFLDTLNYNLDINWDNTYNCLQNLDDLVKFGTRVREWLVKRVGEGQG
jgi:uncharacterized protein YutE (UPF0331/DUF86 family)